MVLDSSNSSTKSGDKLGNTKQLSPAVHWLFTLNNYSQTDIETIKTVCSKSSKICIFQEEIGEEKTPHLQGYIAFKKKTRPLNLFMNLKRIHWEKDKGKSKEYCLKENTRNGNRYIFQKGKWVIEKRLKLIENFKPFQKKIIDLINEEPDDRTINWFYERIGAVGKTALCKYIVNNYPALIMSGKVNDMKNGILSYNKEMNSWPQVIIFDVPRTSLEYLNYSGIEEIKNGLFFSGKYEGGMCNFNSPHVLIFANERPQKEKMSLDRWNIVKIK